jgi:hypothetical protein
VAAAAIIDISRSSSTEAGSMPASFLSDFTQINQIFDDFPIVRRCLRAHTGMNCRNW